jgi:two-component system chemotaxis response regulator CheY
MSKTALIVDDSNTIRMLVGDVLRRLGFKTLEAKTGVEALELVGSAIHLIVSDINMPEMDGITLVQRLRAIPAMRATPILMLTTETSGELKAKAKAVGATGWLTKPFDPSQLQAVVARVCP